MKLSFRTKAALEKTGIKDICELSGLTEGEILREFPIGIKGLREIIAALKEKGLELAGGPIFSSRKSDFSFDLDQTSSEEKIILEDVDRDNFIKKLLESDEQ